MPSKLEVKLRSELHNTGALLLGRVTEVAIRLRDCLRNRILREHQVQVAAAAGERIQRVIEEVVRLCPELQLHPFPDGEVLEHRKVRIEECRSVRRRKQGWAVHAGCRRSGKTVAVDELVRPGMRVRVAGQIRMQLLSIRAQDGLVIDSDPGCEVGPDIRSRNDRG